MKLYEINELVSGALVFDEETGELLNPETGELLTTEEFEQLKVERDSRIDNLLCWMRNLEADAKAYKEEAERFTNKRKQAEKKAESLKKFVGVLLRGEKFKGEHFSVSYRKSTQVVITGKLPEEYLRYKEPEPDKTAIKNAIKAGVDVQGAELKEAQNIVIK